MAKIKAEEDSATDGDGSTPDADNPSPTKGATALLGKIKIEEDSDYKVDLSIFPESPVKKRTRKKAKSEAPEVPQERMLKKRHPGSEDLPEDKLKLVRHMIEAGVHHPMYYIEGIEPASDPDSDSEPDVVVDAVYDILWVNGEERRAAQTGYSIIFKHVDTFSNPWGKVPVRRYKAYFGFDPVHAVLSCIRHGYKAYTSFKTLQRNSFMKKWMPLADPVEIDMLHGVIDDNGFPLLKWSINASAKKEYKKGDMYVYYGWAKRRATPTSPTAELSNKERECLHELDPIVPNPDHLQVESEAETEDTAHKKIA